MRDVDLVNPGLHPLAGKLRRLVAQLISEAEIAKDQGAGASTETLAASLSAFFADAKAKADAVVARP